MNNSRPDAQTSTHISQPPTTTTQPAAGSLAAKGAYHSSKLPLLQPQSVVLVATAAGNGCCCCLCLLVQENCESPALQLRAVELLDGGVGSLLGGETNCAPTLWVTTAEVESYGACHVRALLLVTGGSACQARATDPDGC